MKRSWIITILFCLLLLGVGVTVILLPQTVPYSQCSEVYRRYASVDGIDATFIRDYQVNDTLFVDATLLHATDSASWATLKTDFEIPELPPDFMERINDGQDLVFTKKIPKQQGISAQDTCGIIYYVAAFSHLMHTVSIFHTKDINERYAVMYHNYDHNVRQCTKDTPQ